MQMLPHDQQDDTKLLALGELFAANGGYRAAVEAMRTKSGVAGFMERVTRNREREPIARAADAILGFSSDDKALGGYSITRALRASFEAQHGAKDAWQKAGLERDISNLATTQADTVPNGFFVPLGLMARDFNAGTAGEAGNLIASGIGGDRVADPMRKVSVVGGLGATILTGLRTTLSLPRFASSTTPGWKSEIAAATQLAETTALATLTPKRVAVQMILSRQALLQGTPALDQTINRHLLAAIWQQIDDGAINGDGASDSPVGVRSTSGVGNVVGGTDGAQLTFAHLADLEAAPALANAPETDLSGYAVNQATRRWLRTAARGTNLPYIWDGGERPLLGHRAVVSLTLPSNLSKGASGAVCSALCYSSDWSQLVVGIYGGGVDILLDRVTAADIGKIKITASVLVGVGVNEPARFAKMDDAKTA
jgi:HK97 family phage major capsid protein